MSKVIVVPSDPRWIEEFEIASSEVRLATADSFLEIHHIGSTSIPDIHAKPIIDMLAVADDISALDKMSEEMKSLGYQVRGEFGIEGRRYFCRDNSAGERTHQIHAFQVGSPHIHRHLVFRDFMRTHSELALQYSDLKRKLADAHPDDLNAYMDGKDDFIKDIEVKAMAWDAAGR